MTSKKLFVVLKGGPNSVTLFVTPFLVVLLFFFIISGCTDSKMSNNETSSTIKIRVDGVTFDHVVIKRDWCRFSRIYLEATFFNLTSDAIYLNLEDVKSFCKLEETNADVIITGDNKLKFKVLNSQKNAIHEEVGVAQGDSIKAYLLLLHNFSANSLNTFTEKYKYVYQTFEEEYEANFKSGLIAYVNNKKPAEISIETHTSFDFTYMLDDTLINRTDSASWHYQSTIPPIKEWNQYQN